MQKETFIIRTEWYDSIAELDPIDQATILRNLFAYHLGKEIVLDTFAVRIVWKLIEPTLSRNIDSYDRRRETSAENGKKGGRGHKSTEINQNKPIINQNNLNDNLGLDDKPIQSLSDYVYVSVSDSVSDSDSVSEQNPHTPEKNKTYADLALPSPGPDNLEDAQYYEIEICKNLRLPPDKLIYIWNKWMNSRKDKLFTKREARMDFRSYASSIAMDTKATQHTSTSTTKTLEYAPSG